MSTKTDEQTHTNLWVSKETASRLKDLKPFESLTWDEFVTELADVYELHQEVGRND